VSAPAPRCGAAVPRGGILARLQRALAIALLPAAIVPVLVLGPGIVRAPEALLRRLVSDVQRLQEGR